ncbi:MAG: AAA family ATPase [Prevotella sp.]|nr:AAA family ATPase [Prevotella sp.]
MGMTPTQEQTTAVSRLWQFFMATEPQPVMLIRGSAGTGKTTLTAAIVRVMLVLRQHLLLMAPTGRAAKVLAAHCSHPAHTIHRIIYRQQKAADIGPFDIAHNSRTHTLFIVDEASMISAQLLHDLILYAYSGQGCRLMLIGDSAQLPPIGEQESPALQTDTLSLMQLTPFEATLSAVLRQGQDSGILYNATLVRRMITHSEMTQLPKLLIKGFADVSVCPGDELIEQLANSYAKVGQDDTIVICRSNKRAVVFNRGIRAQILGHDEELSAGDRVMVVRNKYLDDGTLIANGDRAIIQRLRNHLTLYGFRFCDATICLPDYDDMQLTTPMLLDTLHTEAPALTTEQQEQLRQAILDDYADLPTQAERIRQLKSDPHWNAIQLKFAYAVTCHKAQGGQWAHVYVDQGYMTDDMLTPDYIHWLYTAFTRATTRLYLVNWPKTQVENKQD